MGSENNMTLIESIKFRKGQISLEIWIEFDQVIFYFQNGISSFKDFFQFDKLKDIFAMNGSMVEVKSTLTNNIVMRLKEFDIDFSFIEHSIVGSILEKFKIFCEKKIDE